MKRRGWIIALCAMALLVAALYFAVNFNARRVTEEERKLLEDAINRAVITCYVVEGRYPATLGYLEENYGIRVDSERYVVFYDSFADNILPSIRVVEREKGVEAR
ncbi:MAG: hypothetical protein GX592_00165 [Clostridiales bacterium]|nr:hypothetical protein [Clostridiales bacterium]